MFNPSQTVPENDLRVRKQVHEDAHPVRVVMVPGWKDSGPGHWQSLWAANLPHAVRVQQDDWMFPRRSAWVQALADVVLSQPGPVVLAAHSLGCMATVHLPPEVVARISGALLVAPADPERRSALADFAPVPFAKLPYRSLVVASTTDPFCPVRLAGAYARAWGSEFLRLPGAGHINVESGHGHWPLGLALLHMLTDEAAARCQAGPAALDTISKPIESLELS